MWHLLSLSRAHLSVCDKLISIVIILHKKSKTKKKLLYILDMKTIIILFAQKREREEMSRIKRDRGE